MEGSDSIAAFARVCTVENLCWISRGMLGRVRAWYGLKVRREGERVSKRLREVQKESKRLREASSINQISLRFSFFFSLPFLTSLIIPLVYLVMYIMLIKGCS